MRKLFNNRGVGLLELIAIFMLASLLAMAICSVLFGRVWP
jgi:hypothetical protein